ncbi:hypothetical protein ABW19_dt0200059 [Dactylella cylindrospora]|nr:hypothetical protein ABW19_dt0200059 [Dactylella cylindrospora]
MASRETHEIFKDSFFIPQIEAVRTAAKKSHEIDDWLTKEYGSRTYAHQTLQKLYNEIMDIIIDDNKDAKVIENKPKWNAKIKKYTIENRHYERTLKLKVNDMRLLKRDVLRIKELHTEMKKVVQTELPKFYWESSYPMRRILEIQETIKKLVEMNLGLKEKLDLVSREAGNASTLLWNCQNVLNNEDEEIEQTGEGSQQGGGDRGIFSGGPSGLNLLTRAVEFVEKDNEKRTDA